MLIETFFIFLASLISYIKFMFQNEKKEILVKKINSAKGVTVPGYQLPAHSESSIAHSGPSSGHSLTCLVSISHLLSFYVSYPLIQGFLSAHLLSFAHQVSSPVQCPHLLSQSPHMLTQCPLSDHLGSLTCSLSAPSLLTQDPLPVHLGSSILLVCGK